MHDELNRKQADEWRRIEHAKRQLHEKQNYYTTVPKLEFTKVAVGPPTNNTLLLGGRSPLASARSGARAWAHTYIRTRRL